MNASGNLPTCFAVTMSMPLLCRRAKIICRNYVLFLNNASDGLVFDKRARRCDEFVGQYSVTPILHYSNAPGRRRISRYCAGSGLFIDLTVDGFSRSVSLADGNRRHHMVCCEVSSTPDTAPAAA